MLISPLVDKHRKAGAGGYALAVAVALLLATAAPQGVAQTSSSTPPGGAPTLTPVALPSDQGAGTPAVAAPVAPPVPQTEIQARLERSGLAVAGEHLHVALLRRFYAAHSYEPVWDSRQAQAAALTQAITRAGDHGLDPEVFHLTALRNAASLPTTDRDLLLSDAFLSYADALARGVLPVELRMDDEDLKPEPVDAALALDTVISSANPVAAIEALTPSTPEYQALRQALRYYQTAAAAPAPAAARNPHAAPAQRQAQPAKAPANPAAYQSRIREVAVNLERLRWLPHSMPADRVWVNTANAQLVLYRGNRAVFTTRVVVGETDKQTPEVQATINSVLFNPPWNVPRSIAAKEIYPKLAGDPDYLAKHHMIVRKGGLIQQLPGEKSALGQVKFEMPNRFDVYLHDTPLKNLFSSDSRRRSHGCVRVQNPRELAVLLLQRPMETINQRIALGHTNSLSLPEPVPVFFVYQTAFIGENGALEFRPDVYQRDEEVWQHLHRASQAPVAEHEQVGQRRS